jgi:hypothetical protein
MANEVIVGGRHRGSELVHLDATIRPTILLDVEGRAQAVSLAQTLSLMELSPGICFSLLVQAAFTMLAMGQDVILGASSQLDDCAPRPACRAGALVCSSIRLARMRSGRRKVAGDVFRVPAEDHVDFGMLLQFFKRICPRRVQQSILRLRFIDPSCYQ